MFEDSPIRTVIFDLDGTLVETEHLKAEAYAELVGDLTGRGSPAPEAIDLYRSIVGATDIAVCKAMIDRFSLHKHLRSEPGEAYENALHRMRMALYRRSYGTPENLTKLVYEDNIRLARTASTEGLNVGVATMSFSEEARRVIEAIGLSDVAETVVGVDDVALPKPAPDAFMLAMGRLNSQPSQTLIIEDSPRGAHAAAASGARWLCVATEFSTAALRLETELDPQWIVWDPADLDKTVARRIAG